MLKWLVPCPIKRYIAKVRMQFVVEYFVDEMIVIVAITRLTTVTVEECRPVKAVSPGNIRTPL